MIVAVSSLKISLEGFTANPEVKITDRLMTGEGQEGGGRKGKEGYVPGLNPLFSFSYQNLSPLRA